MDIKRQQMNQTIKIYAQKAAKSIKGAFGEFGVHRGDALLQSILPVAKRYGRETYALDSFKGMPKPGEFDGEGYPEGKFNVGGDERLKKQIKDGNFDCEVIAGFIPETLEKIPSETIFAFLHLDLDHYQPTKDVLEWWLNHSISGSIIICHDYNPKNTTTLASKALHEFKRKAICNYITREASQHIIFFKK